MPSPTTFPPEQLTALRDRMVVRFDIEELRLLVFDLDENYDDLRGETISSKTQALLERLDSRGRLPDLIDRLKQLRPIEEWDNILPAEPEAVSPYKGLRYFNEADAPLFFGRERATAELVDHK